MKIDTLLFGELEVGEEEVIRFPSGLPGFEGMKHFVMIRPDEEIPFSYMQCVTEPKLSFIITDPFLFYKDYEFELSELVREELEVDDEQEIMVRSVVSIKDDLQNATLNLLAPIIVNVRKRVGKQVVLRDPKYTTRHRLIKENIIDEQIRQEGDAEC